LIATTTRNEHRQMEAEAAAEAENILIQEQQMKVK